MERQPHNLTELNQRLDDFQCAEQMLEQCRNYMFDVLQAQQAAPEQDRTQYCKWLRDCTANNNDLRAVRDEIAGAIASQLKPHQDDQFHYYIVRDRLVAIIWSDGPGWFVSIKDAPLTPEPWHIVIEEPEQPEPETAQSGTQRTPIGNGLTYRQWMIGQALVGAVSHGSSPHLTGKSAIAIADACIAQLDSAT